MFRVTVHSIPGLFVFYSFIEGLIESFLCKTASLYKSPCNVNISFHDHLFTAPLAFPFNKLHISCNRTIT